MHNQRFGDNGALALSIVLASIPNDQNGLSNVFVTSLDLRGTHLTDAGAAAIARSIDPIKGNSSNSVGSAHLADLSLAHNKIGDLGACALAAALSRNTVLVALHLGDNEVTQRHSMLLVNGYNAPDRSEMAAR